jgi:diguanylate cyclase (GGDEF)-like protein
VATDNGIAIVDPVAFTVRSLHRADGVSITAYWAGSAARTRAGDLVFGGIGGLTVIRPDRFEPWNYRPPIVVTDARVGGRSISGGRWDDPSGDAQLLVQPGANSLAIQFSALDFSAPELNRYAYLLEGYDRDWTETDARQRMATYANLPPGRYLLRLRGSNRDGLWTEGSLDLPLRVLPIWYQTTWFKITATLLAILAVLALVQGRTLFLRRRQRDLECLVAERTAALEESKRRIEQLAYQDSLTGLANRRLFTDNIHMLLAQAERQQRRFALLMVDLDRFKHINDTLGHDAGDALLIAAAQRLQSALRGSDRIARLGGDEFAILLEDLPATHAAQMDCVSGVCQRLIDGFVDAVAFNDAQMRTSASIGVAIYPDHGTTREELCKSADLALYEAKRSGRNAWRCHASQDVAATT